MKEIFQLVGETAAHSIWAVADGDNLDPILTTMDKAGKSQFLRLAMEDSADAVRYGHDKLDRQDEGNIGAVFVADGFITLDSGKTDALVVEVRVYNGTVAKCQMVIPYRPANSEKGFAVHRPQVTELENIEQEHFHPLMQAFFQGLEGHQQGSRIWNQYYVDDIDGEHSKSIVGGFSEAEWGSLLLVPALLSCHITQGSGLASTTKQTVLKNALLGSAKYQSNLLHSIVSDCVPQIPEFVESLEEADIDYIEELSRIREIVDDKVPSAEAKGFKIALIAVASELAKASCDIVAIGDAPTDKRNFALANVILCLNMELDS